MGRKSKKEEISVNTELTHFAVQQKLTQHCKAAIAVVVVQSLNHVQHFANQWIAACQAFLSFTISRHSLTLMSIESVMPSSHLTLCHLLLLLPSIFPSIRVFSNESALHIRWPKYWSFSFSMSPSNEYLEWSSFRIDWFELLAVQGTLKSLLQFYSSKASILQRSAFFMVQQGWGNKRGKGHQSSVKQPQWFYNSSEK